MPTPSAARLAKGLYWDRAWSLVEGCTPVSPGCDHCWALRQTYLRSFNPNPKIRERYGGLINYDAFGRSQWHRVCFCNKQQSWLDLNWIDSKSNKWGTQAALIGDYNTKTTGIFSSWGAKAGEKCRSCPHFTTIHTISGQQCHVYHETACLGKADCYAAVSRGSKKKGQEADKKSSGAAESDAPRVAWHGEHFRQEFYKEEIFRLLEALPAADSRRRQLALACILYSCDELHAWFYEKLGRTVPQMKHDWQTFTLPFHRILKLAGGFEYNYPDNIQVETFLAEALVQIALHTGYGNGNWDCRLAFTDHDRQALAEFLDIDWSRYRVTEEYLEKKTKAELVRFIAHDSGLAGEPAFLEAMKKPGHPHPGEAGRLQKTRPNRPGAQLRCGPSRPLAQGDCRPAEAGGLKT